MADEKSKIVEGFQKFVTGANELLPEDKKFELQPFVDYLTDVFQPPPRVSEWDGFRLYPGFEAETAKYAFDKLAPKEGDVLVASYMKTGTTWTTEIVRNLLYYKDQETLEKAKKITQMFSYLEFGPVSKYQVTENLALSRRFFGTHLPPNLVNMDKLRRNNTKILYVYRNPKDQLVSWYNFVKKDVCNLFPKTEREFYDVHIAGKQGCFGKDGEGYLEHIKAWHQHKDDKNVLFLMYEEMKGNLRQEVRKIAEFIGVQVDNDNLEKICNNCTFDTMKKAATNDNEDFANMFRKGKIGSWKDRLTVAQSDLIDRNVEKTLQGLDISFIYE